MKDYHKKSNQAYIQYKRYEQEIFIDAYDTITKSNSLLIKNVLDELESNEIHHILKYHQEITLNALYFKNQKMFIDYHQWLYRVYFYKNIQLDFFKALNETIQNICSKYIEIKAYINISNFYEKIYEEHENLKEQAHIKRQILDNTNDATDFAKLLINGENKKAYEFIKKRNKNIEDFLIFHTQIISNAMKYIGYEWECNKLSIAKEHVASNTLEEVILKTIEEFSQEKQKDIQVFLSSAPNELHGLGIKIASKILQKLGYKVINLGVNIPSKEVKKAIMQFQPDFVILTSTLQTSLVDVAVLIDEIIKDKAIYSKDFKIAIAGGAFEKIINPAKVFKTDFYLKQLKDITNIFEEHKN